MNKRIFKNNLYALKLMWRISKKYTLHMLLVRFLGYFEWLFYSAFFMRYVINAMEEGQTFERIMIFLGITVLVFGAMTLYNSYIEQSFLPTEKVKISDKLSRILIEKNRRVDIACFEDSDFYDKYTLAMENADVRLCETINEIWGIICGAIAAIFSFIYMYKIDKMIGLFVLFPIVGNFFFGNFLSKIEFNRNKDMAIHNRRILYINRVMYMKEYSKELRLTKVFAMIKKHYNEAITGISDVTNNYSVKGAIFHWLKCMFTFCIIFEGSFLYGAYRALVIKTMPLAVLAVVTSMMVASSWILIYFAEAIANSLKYGLFVDNLRGFLEHEPSIPEDYDGVDPGDTIEKIEFRNVSFSYKDKEIIHNMSLEIRGGQTYALVGHNGAGKSTIIKLLMRFYDPTEGEIYLNGKNVKEYNLKKYRQLFATAFQEQQIFAMSVRDNVLMRRTTEADDEIVINALSLAGVYDKIKTLKRGINTMLTKEFDNDGAVLSGGEFQKIVVARAFVRDTPAKIFDEPSSALDPISENQLFKNIMSNGSGKTMLFISHRLSSVQNADWVFMLEQGKVIEQGTHKMLMDNQGTYADMYEKQAINYLALSEDDYRNKKDDIGNNNVAKKIDNGLEGGVNHE
ncbi:MAG: ABC transporter ATP-binding protein [Lachnospiraceae bacterium]|nr:ABC transporter ATP-binding protein [Lachnospiraceae bacterium]